MKFLVVIGCVYGRQFYCMIILWLSWVLQQVVVSWLLVIRSVIVVYVCSICCWCGVVGSSFQYVQVSRFLVVKIVVISSVICSQVFQDRVIWFCRVLLNIMFMIMVLRWKWYRVKILVLISSRYSYRFCRRMVLMFSVWVVCGYSFSSNGSRLVSVLNVSRWLGRVIVRQVRFVLLFGLFCSGMLFSVIVVVRVVLLVMNSDYQVSWC